MAKIIRLIAKPIKSLPSCPICGSIMRYYRKKTGDYLCRRCGTVYDRTGKAVQVSIPGTRMVRSAKNINSGVTGKTLHRGARPIGR